PVRLTAPTFCPILPARGKPSCRGPARSLATSAAMGRLVRVDRMHAAPPRARLDSHEDADVMLTTDLGACEWFVWDLRRSNLIDRGQLDQVIGEFLTKNPGAEPPLLAEFLVKKSYLTEFQAERLLQGKTQGFVLGPFTL